MTFGTWLPCDDGRVHYLLGGSPLCGSPAAATGAAAPTKKYPGCGAVPVTYRDCPTCRDRNEQRWAARPLPPVTPVPAGTDTSRPPPLVAAAG